jgi:hypothetical protein
VRNRGLTPVMLKQYQLRRALSQSLAQAIFIGYRLKRALMLLLPRNFMVLPLSDDRSSLSARLMASGKLVLQFD